jgi:hypothetical protein
VTLISGSQLSLLVFAAVITLLVMSAGLMISPRLLRRMRAALGNLGRRLWN